ncbi:MAG: CBS domain-containing protein [Acidimicrobiia bacterium]|nr:CBS domain-containing protein [Acidimicrobiia bacterium]
MQRTVAHILERKGGDVWTVSSDTTVLEALGVMADKNIGALVVQDGDTIVGILSERDYARKVILKGKGSKGTAVGEIMTPDPVTVEPHVTVTECMGLMTDNRFRHLPVVKDGALVGVISIGDVVNSVIEEQTFLIDQLEGYITS